MARKKLGQKEKVNIMVCGIELEIKDEHNNIAINLSGGTDSALITILTCMDITERKLNKRIVPITGCEVNRPYNVDAAEKILGLIKKRFPNVEFADHYIHQYDVPKDIHGEPRTRIKANAHRNHEVKLFTNEEIDVIYAGISQNPPWKNLPESHPLRRKREKNREANNGYLEKWLHGGMFDRGILWYHRPLYNQNKSKVAELYHELSLMEDIFPLTESCIGQAEATKFFTEPCKKCWWCHEKKWAFGMYDGGVT